MDLITIEKWLVEGLLIMLMALLAMFLFCKGKDCCDKFDK